MNYDSQAAERVRQLLSERADVTEKRMVGGLSFLVNGAMCCGVTGTGLMIRIGADGRAQALAEPYARPVDFAGRALSGFICVDPAGFATDQALAAWVQRGLDFVSRLPAQRAGRASSPACPAPGTAGRTRPEVPGAPADQPAHAASSRSKKER